ncbi:MAG: prepilin-type N-terminal cleavage/methylation domain-containing protein [Opitutales bacterium]|nr:prepilin-type N-terminal cleavage/methylation domain-containing protein [Opitutales bacterium]MCH8541028.1 prepilin-type N-terminal cleavage/methylation domain-containing protein [Opitutales bacterium]
MKIYDTESPRRGFSIIEVLIATTITAALGVILVALTSDILRVWRQSGGQLSLNSEARLALEILDQDMQSVLLRNDGRQWIFLGAQNEKDWEPTANTSPFPDSENQVVGFFRNTSAGPQAVLYRLIEQPLYRGGTTAVFQLVRTEMSAADTLFTPMDWRENAVDFFWPEGFWALIDKGDIENDHYDGEEEDEPFVTRDIIATRVISFAVEFFPEEQFPREIVIRLTFLSSEGEQALENLEAGRIAIPSDTDETTFREELLSRESQTFRKVIYPKTEL